VGALDELGRLGLVHHTDVAAEGLEQRAQPLADASAGGTDDRHPGPAGVVLGVRRAQEDGAGGKRVPDPLRDTGRGGDGRADELRRRPRGNGGADHDGVHRMAVRRVGRPVGHPVSPGLPPRAVPAGGASVRPGLADRAADVRGARRDRAQVVALRRGRRRQREDDERRRLAAQVQTPDGVQPLGAERLDAVGRDVHQGHVVAGLDESPPHGGPHDAGTHDEDACHVVDGVTQRQR
jgi:hypothetical protein